MTRPILEEHRIAPDAAKKIADFHADVVREVQEAVLREPVVVVGMAQNPNVKNARKALDDAGISFKYLEYGSYLSEWRRRLAIKLWSGWPTFPQVFVRGQLLGGADMLKESLANGTFKAKLEAATESRPKVA